MLIRADASPQIGAGHVMRCLSLAQAARAAAWDVVFLSHGDHEPVRRRVEAAGCRWQSLERVQPHPGDLKETLAAAREAAASWVVADGYIFDEAYQAALRDAGFRLMAVDDHRHLERYHADVLFNQNIHAERLRYAADPGTVFLLGPRYAMLNRAFLPWRDRPREIPAMARRALVSLGGADPDNVTARVVEALRGLDVEARVIVGGLNRHRDQLRAQLPDNAELLVDVTDMPAQMAWADLAILGAGSTCWEAAFLGLPVLMIVLADNQRRIAAGLDEEGIGVSLGEHADLKSRMIAERMGEMMPDAGRRRAMSAAGRALVDGGGAARVLAALQSALVRLRPAVESDARALWEWANDPAVRSAAFHPEPIPWEDHVRWFEAKRRSGRTAIYMAADEEGQALGQIRFDGTDGSEAEVDVSVASSRRGEGWGPALIRAGCDRLFADRTAAAVRALVKPENEPSLRAFAGADFDPEDSVAVAGRPVRCFIRRRPHA
ncbi:MAG TPA: UDP-2,4-diacetamido-2,4,6-trideoxy-beta-L-altropyranose hydrolase [Kiritimatiellia bacterium]|nr:UDP-2,4-diacetamido-2,4,6-trideoxy-beta-L-altropyranose hydrolase [Kiritimatiellia bacterium]HRZ11475.1 UDP-2,4-diacetamido-2,4,6-trideoxy-beta-L-altropyranose hydrolase [Kiritimatiellia bacterium]HSA16974.1 UDP-2,4-diacetamido-2,4,6-trideoxy-beta-L-altropyranose hydrolase [Kiritimatiellia bacterium]